MTLIAGVRGIRKSYIIADSRATITTPNGDITYNDSAKKWINHGRYSLCAIAGDAHLGAHITKRLVDDLGIDPNYREVKVAFDENLEAYAKEYNQKTGRFTKCALILVGFDPKEKDEFDAGRLGEVMANGVTKHGEGITVDQSLDKEIIRAMHYAFEMSAVLGTPLNRGRMVSVGLPKSDVLGYEVAITSQRVKITKNEAKNFEAIFYGADSAYNRIELPDDVLSEMYFRDITGMNGSDILMADTMQLFVFFHKVITDRNYQNVGGGIFPVLMTPDGGSFYGGGITKQSISTGQAMQIRDTDVINGKVCFKDSNGEIKEYQSLLDLVSQLPRGYEATFDIPERDTNFDIAL
jgi:hypothetical protein